MPLRRGEYQNTEALLKEADKRMYQDKNKNKVKETFQ